MRFDGRARDLFTGPSLAEYETVAEDAYVATVKVDRTITALSATPHRDYTAQLVGERGGGHLREVLRHLMPEEIRQASPLYLILDDISGTSLISGWAWSHWDKHWVEQFKGRRDEIIQNMEGVCIGFRSGSGALDPKRFDSDEKVSDAAAVELLNPEDPNGWHAFTVQNQVGMRRARRIDVWLEDSIKIDAAFQDSASTPSGGRLALHEYAIHVEADPKTLRITRIDPQPKVLPFGECTAAPAKTLHLLDAPLNELRQYVLDHLPNTSGCTHLNDALRSLAEVPQLFQQLKQRLS